MQTLSTLIRHLVTYVVGMLIAWLTIYLTGPDLETATAAANALVEPLVILAGFAAVILSRLAMPVLNQLFRRGAGEADNGGGTLPLALVGWMVVGAMAAGTLPSCSPSAGEYPLTATLSFRDPSGAKAGITYAPRFPQVERQSAK